MTKYEILLDEASKKDITVIENYDLSGTQLKGLYCDNMVAIGNTTDSNTERACVLAEELGHHYTAAGNILDQSTATKTASRKCVGESSHIINWSVYVASSMHI